MTASAPTIAIRAATRHDLPRLHALVERAYRGPSARAGWTHEADLLEGQRTDLATLEAVVAARHETLLIALQNGSPVGCVQVIDLRNRSAYLGMLCVEPVLQAVGLGRRLIAAAEALATTMYRARRIEMSVISSRSELIHYYERRGYRPTGEHRAFPVPVDPPLALAVLGKALAA